MTPQEVREMQEAFTAFKNANDAALAEVKKYGQKSGVLEEKVTKLNAALEEIEYHALYAVAVTTGMRKGELFGLKWSVWT